MRSFVTFAVEHGDSTDPLMAFIANAHAIDPSGNDSYSVIDYTVKVDVQTASVKEITELLNPMGNI